MILMSILMKDWCFVLRNLTKKINYINFFKNRDPRLPI